MRHMHISKESILSPDNHISSHTNITTSKYFYKRKEKNSLLLNKDKNGTNDGINETTGIPYKIDRWDQIYQNLKSMRILKNAPVDTMGAQKLFDLNSDPKTQRFHILVSLMLSSQTKDQITAQAISRLHNYNLTVQNICDINEDDLQKIIYPVGFYKRKAGYLKSTARILLEKYDGDIPKSLEELCQLPGVGPKMAYLALNIAWGKVEGIAVDTHVHRISNRLQLVDKPTKSPEKTRISLESWLPKEYWNEINSLLVGFGQQICLPVHPKCNICLNKSICPYFKSNPKYANNDII